MPILDGRVDAMAGRVVIPDDRLERLRGTVMERRLALLASTDDVDFDAPSRLVGANMAFGRHVLQRVPSFDVKLGAGPDSLGYGEETLFAWQLLDMGYRIGGNIDAPVIHNFEWSRVDRASTDMVARRFGASQAYIAFHWHGKRLSGITARILKARGMHLLKRMLVGMLHGRERELAEDELRFNHLSWMSYLRQFKALQHGG